MLSMYNPGGQEVAGSNPVAPSDIRHIFEGSIGHAADASFLLQTGSATDSCPDSLNHYESRTYASTWHESLFHLS